MSFVDDVNKALRDKDEVQTEKANQLRERYYGLAERDYQNAKIEILCKAKNGNYNIYNGKKRIVYIMKNGILFQLDKKSEYITIKERRGLFLQNVSKTKQTVTLRKEDSETFQYYMYKLQQLADHDGIKVKPVILEKAKNKTYDFPYKKIGNLGELYWKTIELAIEYCIEL